jgi:hypothetical protein
MPNYRAKPHKITWGAAFANTLNLGDGLDQTNAYPILRAGGEQTQYRSGVEDAWDAGTDQMFTGVARWVPRDNGSTGFGNAITGWNGATGFAAFLSWARLKNVVRFYPDPVGTPALFYPCYLVEPMADPPELEDDFSRRVRLLLRTSDGSIVDGF